MTRSWIDLAAAAALLAFLALRPEGKPARNEAPLVGLALLVFLAHVVGAGKEYRSALAPAAVIACRLLALLYLLRWAARAALGSVARWLMGLKPPPRPRSLLLLAASALRDGAALHRIGWDWVPGLAGAAAGPDGPRRDRAGDVAGHRSPGADCGSGKDRCGVSRGRASGERDLEHPAHAREAPGRVER